MKCSWFLILLSATILIGCSTLEVAERPDGDSSLVMMYFKPPEDMRLSSAGIATFVEGGVGKFLPFHRTAKGLVYIENVPPGRYYIREVDMYNVENNEIYMYYFGSPFGMSGYDEYSFTVGKNEVLFVGAYQFGESSLEISTSGAANVGTYDEITKKYCITEILNYVKATSWRTRLEEEFANLN